jgi:hypothetical protein
VDAEPLGSPGTLTVSAGRDGDGVDVGVGVPLATVELAALVWLLDAARDPDPAAARWEVRAAGFWAARCPVAAEV